MSTATEKLKTQNQLITDFDVSKIFRRNNRFEQEPFENTTGAELVIPGGTLVGRVGGTGNLEIMKSAAVDGSQLPLGVTAEESVTLAIGETRQINICVSGDVEETKLIFDGADDLDTVVATRPYRDRIGSDTVGIKLVTADELTDFDNS